MIYYSKNQMNNKFLGGTVHVFGLYNEYATCHRNYPTTEN